MKSARLMVALLLMALAGAVFASGTGEAEVPGISIHEATIMGEVKAIEQHAAAGSDLNVIDQYGSTPLTIAATFGLPEAARALIDGGADVGAPNAEGSSPLHIAAFFCRTEIVEMLLAGGADRDAKNAMGLRPVDMVSAPFPDVKPVYDGILESLSPLGLELDYDYLETTRPRIRDSLSL